jgi:spoIIIJ-associated protein
MTPASQRASQRASEVIGLLEQVLPLMGIEATASIIEADDETIAVDIACEDLSLLIGGRGRTLNALQCIANVAANTPDEPWVRVILDAEGYRERRRISLEKCALKTADQALDEDREVALEPMNAFERRIVHCALSEREDVATDSRGEEPYRFVVVAPAGTKD